MYAHQKKLINDRGQIKAKATRFKTYLDSIEKSNHSHD